MILRGWLLFFALLFPLCLSAQTPATWYVAPGGNDAWSGKLAAANAARTDGPFATVERARDEVRRFRRAQTGPASVVLRGGVYRLARPLELAPEDSGTDYSAYANERPVLSGGRVIRGWKPATVNGRRVWAAQIPEVRAGKWYFHQLWVNGQRRQRARHPNTGFFRITGVPGLDPKAPYQMGQDTFQFAPGQIRRYQNPDDVEVVVLMRWLSTHLHIAAIDEEQRTVKLERRTAQSLAEGFGTQPVFARYYVENAIELLDAPGEWFLDRQSGTLYYLPVKGEDMARADVVAPVLDQLVIARGDPAARRYVERLRFQGLEFSHTNWWLPAGMAALRYQMQAASAIPAALEFSGAREVALERCTVAHISNYAIHFAAGCEKSRVARCQLYDLGAGGIKIGEILRNNQVPTDPLNFTHHIEISDNHIHSGGRAFHQAPGVLIVQSYDNRIVHNHIHDFYYTGVSAGWTWGYGVSLARNNVIEFNHIHDLGQEWLSDLGAIYTLGSQPGTTIRNNLLHDIQAAHYAGRGIYLDEGSSDILVADNVVYNTSHAGFAQNFGKSNTVTNNILAFGREMQVEIGNMPKARTLPNGFVFEGNIVCSAPSAPVWRGAPPRKQESFAHNLYWSGGAEARFGALPFAEWQRGGFDDGSLVADPLFMDAAKRDFRLRPGSPARKIGFRPIDLSHVGPRPPT